MRHVQEKVSTALKAPVSTVIVMRKEEIPDRKSDSVIDLKVSFKFIDFL